jgi:hypothetical protein
MAQGQIVTLRKSNELEEVDLEEIDAEIEKRIEHFDLIIEEEDASA